MRFVIAIASINHPSEKAGKLLLFGIFLRVATSFDVLLPQNLAIGEHDLEHTPNGPPVLDGLHRYRDLITGLEGVHTPATVDQVGWIVGFTNPMHGLATFIFYVELKYGM